MKYMEKLPLPSSSAQLTTTAFHFFIPTTSYTSATMSDDGHHKLPEVSIYSKHSSEESLGQYNEQHEQHNQHNQHSDVEKAWGVVSVVRGVEEEAQEEITTATDWTGPSDPANPYNWPLAKRIFHSAVPAFTALASTFISSAYVPATYAIEYEMSVTREVSLTAYAVFIFGLAVGGPMIAPCSELFGRRIVYIVTTPLLALFVMGTGLSHSIGSLIVSRFFGGIFGSASLVVAAGTMADIWTEEERVIPIAMFVICPFLGPALG